MSRTSTAVSGASAVIMWRNFVISLVMPRVANCASACANHMAGSLGQNGGSLMATCDTGDAWSVDVLIRLT